MIGQRELIETIEYQLKNNTFPHFSIIIGDKGSGKKTLLDTVLSGKSVYKLPDVKVDTIREMIDNAYKVHDTFFIIADADSMSVNAKNSILKVVEEIPNNNYFILTLENEFNTLETIRSRGHKYRMEYYTPIQIEEFAEDLGYVEKTNGIKDSLFLANVCDTPGEVLEIVKYNPKEIREYVNKVIDNIAYVSGSNAFKIGEKVALKNEEGKYDLKLFLKVFIRLCLDKLIIPFNEEDDIENFRWLRGVHITSNYLQDLNIVGCNKQMLFDDWILDIRQEWMGEA